MPQSHVQIHVHLVFSTKGRAAFLQDRKFRGKVHAYLAGICNHLDCPANIVGGVADHVHLLVRLAKQLDVSALVRKLKRDSTKWIKEQNSDLLRFSWQAGYGAFSISPSHVEALTKYIENQEEHHLKAAYPDEYRLLCKKYGIAIDERYAWD